jgi:hypothetical protein
MPGPENSETPEPLSADRLADMAEVEWQMGPPTSADDDFLRDQLGKDILGESRAQIAALREKTKLGDELIEVCGVDEQEVVKLLKDLQALRERHAREMSKLAPTPK